MSLPTANDTKPCPFCEEPIKVVAIKCRHCGELLGDEANPGLWRDGSLLVMSRQAALPDRCVKSNQPVAAWLKRKFHWMPGGLGMQFLVGAIIYAIMAEKIYIQVGLSEKWLRRRRWAIAFGWLSVLAGAAMFCVGLSIVDNRRSPSNPVALILIGIFGGLIGGIVGTLRAQVVTLRKATKSHLWLKGVHRDFLGALPRWPGLD